MWSGGWVTFYHHSDLGYEIGYWNQDEIGYAGLKLIRNDGVHYAWIRTYFFDPNAVIYDFAYETTPDTPIIIGEGIDNKVQICNVEDVSEFGNGKDLLVEFDKIFYYNSMEHYRVLVLKSDSAATFTLEKANLVPPEYYLEIPIDDQNKSFTLLDSSKDIDGDFISANVPYKVFVMTTAFSGIPAENELSLPSEGVILEYNVASAFNLVAYDGGEAGNPSDLKVRFSAPVLHENLVEQYRLITIPGDSVNQFNLEQAMMLPITCYSILEPDGTGNYLGSLNENTLDCYGNPIVADVAYFVKILSFPKPAYASIGALSAPSTIIALRVPSFLKAGELNQSRVDFFDIEPDMGFGQIYPTILDIGNDGIDDFSFEYGDNYPPFQIYTRLESFPHSKAIGIGGFILKLQDSAMISKHSYDWLNTGYFYKNYQYVNDCQGYWTEPADGFAGVQYILEGDTNFAWLRVKTYCNHWPSSIKSYASLKDNYLGYDEFHVSELSVTPNPVIGISELRLKTAMQSEVIVNVVNLMGERCMIINMPKGQTRAIIDFRGLPGGIYLLQIISGSEQQVLKVLKQ
jgi:hypothetical protein